MKKRAEKKAEKVVVIDLFRILMIALLVVMCLLALLGIVSFVRRILPVSNFEVLGDYSYDREDVIAASGLSKSDKLYKIDLREVEKKLLKDCPYLESVKVERVFPGTVRFVVSEKKAIWYVELMGDYYALGDDFTVLEESAGKEKFVSGRIPQLLLPNVKKAVVGEVLIYGLDQSEIRRTETVISEVLRSTFKNRLTLLDIENFDIYIEIDGSYRVFMGNEKNLTEKLETVTKILEDPSLENCVEADIDVSNPSAVSVKPLFSYPENSDGEKE